MACSLAVVGLVTLVYGVGLMKVGTGELASSSWCRSCWRIVASYNHLEHRHVRTTACKLTDFGRWWAKLESLVH